MTIVNAKCGEAGLSGVKPKVVYLEAVTDDYADIQAPNYIKPLIDKFGLDIQPGDLVAVKSTVTGTNIISAMYSVQLTAGVWQLVGLIPDNVTYDVAIPNALAYFANANGEITSAPGNVTHDGDIAAVGQITSGAGMIASGDIQAGDASADGRFVCQTSNPGTGQLIIEPVDNSGDYLVTLKNGAHTGDTNYIFDTQIVGDQYMLTTRVENPGSMDPKYGSNVSVAYSTLAGGNQEPVAIGDGPDNVVVIRDIFMTIQTPFVGGDRDLVITAGGVTYAVVPAAFLGSPANTTARWGDSNISAPPLVGYNEPTALGSLIYAEYSGGSADYTDGDIRISILTQQKQ